MGRALSRRAAIALLVFLPVGVPACQVFSVGGAGAAGPEGIEELVQRLLPAYVFVGGGSGAIISSDGYVITNAHVTGPSKRWRIRTAGGTYYAASVVGTSPGTDLCLMKIDHADNLPYLPLGDSDELAVGDVALAIGNPFALGSIDGKPTVTLGVVSALHVDRPHAYDAIQTDTPINPGNSGGPLINLKGELIGVNAQIETRFGLRQNTGVGYAISSNQVKRFLPTLKEADGHPVAPGRIAGLTLDTQDDAPAIAKAVRTGSPAAEAGLRKGDVIVTFEKTPIDTVRDFRGALGRYPLGAEITLKVRRDAGEERWFKVTITKHGRPYVGFKFERKSARSLTLEIIEPDSPAARAGLRKGDVLMGVGRTRIRSRRAYYILLYRLKPTMTVPFIVRRGGRTAVVQVTIGEKD